MHKILLVSRRDFIEDHPYQGVSDRTCSDAHSVRAASGHGVIKDKPERGPGVPCWTARAGPRRAVIQALQAKSERELFDKKTAAR